MVRFFCFVLCGVTNRIVDGPGNGPPARANLLEWERGGDLLTGISLRGALWSRRPGENMASVQGDAARVENGCHGRVIG